MKTLVITGVLSLALAWPVAAQRMEIGDDGFTTVPEDTSSGPLIDIDDDGWSEVSPEASQDLNSIVGTPGQCTELESSAGLSASECGTLTRGEIIRRLDG